MVLLIAVGNLFVGRSTAAVCIVWFHANIVHWVVQNCRELLHLRTVAALHACMEKSQKAKIIVPLNQLVQLAVCQQVSVKLQHTQ